MSAASPDEAALVAGLRAGDARAWQALFRAYAQDVGGYLRLMTGRAGDGDVDDLVQRVLLQASRSIHGFRGDSGLRTWLHGIARHVASHERRGRQRRRAAMRAYADVQPEGAPSHEARLDARQRLARVRAALDRLDDPFRDVWILREVQGLTVSEVAELLDVPEATVRTRHHRARRRLLDGLEAAEGGGTAGGPLRLVSGGKEEPR